MAVGVMNLGPTNDPGLAHDRGSAALWEAFVEADARGGGIGTELLRRSVDWARSRGHSGMVLDFRTANLPGARFWQGHGFRPRTTILRRLIDPRIAWADGTNE
jgi:GNAT superfamily N-acetyltransferase